MNKLNQEQIKEIRKLREQGKTYNEIAKMFKVSHSAINYQLSEDLRNKKRIYNRERYRSMNPQQKKEYLEKIRNFQRQYQRKKYKTDKEFRERQKERAKKYQREYYKKLKGGKKNE